MCCALPQTLTKGAGTRYALDRETDRQADRFFNSFTAYSLLNTVFLATLGRTAPRVAVFMFFSVITADLFSFSANA